LLSLLSRFYLALKLDQAHIDLRYLLGSVGSKGGLKKCEEAIGIDRGDLNKRPGRLQRQFLLFYNL
jgi:uncharacterized protein YprB with RNaseH-like and TPR domain